MAKSKRMTRAQAKQEGLTTYYTGKRCIRGHLASRYTSTGACTECMKLFGQQNAAINKAIGTRQNLVKQLRKLIPVAA